MDKETKQTIIIAVIAVIMIGGVYVGISKASGVDPSQTIVESGSMQHGIGSNFGVIDTGDVIIVKDKGKADIISFVEGYNIGYKTFSNYGDVIIYDRGSVLNSVIHRAILWLDYNGDGTWSAPALVDYPSDLWSASSGNDPMRLSGTLTIKNLGYTNSVTASVSLDRLVALSSPSGYLTMGDNNMGFDQPASLAGVSGLIPYEKIVSVAWIEIPWLGSLKMMLNGKGDAVDRWVPDTIPSLTATMISIIFLVVGISFLYDYRYYTKHKKELTEEMNAPTPSFPVEDKK